MREYSGRIDFNSFSDFNSNVSIDLILSHIFWKHRYNYKLGTPRTNNIHSKKSLVRTSTEGILSPTTSSHCFKDGVFLSFGVLNRIGFFSLLFNCTENILTSLPWNNENSIFKDTNKQRATIDDLLLKFGFHVVWVLRGFRMYSSGWSTFVTKSQWAFE